MLLMRFIRLYEEKNQTDGICLFIKGAIETPLTEALKKTNPEIMDWFAKAAPVGRLGLPADLTPMVCYLLSDAGSFNTGADMVVTGTFLGTFEQP